MIHIKQFRESWHSSLLTWKQFHTNPIIRISSIGILTLIAAAFGIFFFMYAKLPPMIPLWYSKPWSNDRLADTPWLLILPVFAIFWYIVNTFSSLILTKNHLVYAQILYVSSLFIALFSTIALAAIIWITL